MLGIVLVVVSLWQRRSIVRVLAFVLLLLLAGAEWTFLLGTPLPPYSGPIKIGQPFPAFATSRADGKSFSQQELQGDKDNVLVFFRGRW
jgi:cytochrome oxidase Cu insertion factor (SCO1/SenC/PrrC family)